MCPLYKKNNKAKIANYRPILLLNTDYKIMTKALAIKLAQAAPSLIHPSQAGFVPERNIYDYVWLIKRIIDLAEVEEQNGMIVFLNQKKAYDKIEHDYLWKTLAVYKIPDQFISTVKTLYSDAHTTVYINGVASSTSFQVSRGVCQGNPLSCLLFDLAIEPLAEMLRQLDLQGFKVPGVKEKIIATLFADDTTVFLSQYDDFTELTAILKEWCTVSGARFNIDKTEILPIGVSSHCDAVYHYRNSAGLDMTGSEIPEDIKIAKDGEAVRTLGAWVGNKVKQVDVWTHTLDKIEENLGRWELEHPTMEGRQLIIIMVVGGMTQYLTEVQEMPTNIEKWLECQV